MKLRISTGIACLSAIALVATACGGEDSGGDGDTLTVWIMEGTNPNAEPYFEEIGKKFEEQTGATLDVEYVAWADAQKKFNNAIGGGTTPDVAEVGTTWTPGFTDAGALTDMSSYVEESGGADRYIDSLVEAGTYDGGLYGVPWYAGVRGVVYRKDVFAKAGVKPPKSWDELVTVANKIKQAEPDMMPFPIPGVSEYSLDPFIWGAGGQIATEQGGEWTSQIDSPQAREGIQFYTELATEHGFSSAAAQSWDEVDVSDSFTSGKSAMILSGSWTPKAIVEETPELKGKVGAFPLPGQDGGIAPTFVGGSHLGVFNTAEDPELAWEFVDLMTSGEFARKWWEQSTYFPADEAVLKDVMAEQDPLVAPFAKQMLQAGETVPVTPLYEKVQGKATLTAMVQEILSDGASVDEATSNAADEMNQIFQGG